MRSNKKIMSLVLAIVMILTMIPTMAFATDTEYGPQGKNTSLTLKSPSDIEFLEESTMNDKTWYKNRITTDIEPVDGIISFGYNLTSGFNNFQEATFNTYKDDINVLDQEGNVVKGVELGANNGGFNTTDKIVTFTVDASNLEAGKYTLRFGPSVSGNNTAKNTDSYIDFEFNLKGEMIAVTGITLDKAEETLLVGGTTAFQAIVTPDNATDISVTWTSSNNNVATVDENGTVIAKNVGTAVITARTTDGEYEASATVTVNPIAVTSVKLNYTSVQITKGYTKKLTATVSPSNATNKAVTWTTSNSKIAKVSSSGTVTAVAPGKATITVKTKDGAKTAKATITVMPKNTTFSLRAAKKSITIKYSKVSGVTGYTIYRASSKNGTYYKVTTRTASKTGSYTNSKLKSKHTYYYKIKTYKTVNGVKYYSNSSVVKCIKTK